MNAKIVIINLLPTYKEVMFATHLATTRHLKCPKCHKRSWAKKVMSK